MSSSGAYGAEERLRDARRHWLTAEERVAAGDMDAALARLTRAHDLVTDLPSAHREAHRRLLPVDRALRRKRDVVVDRLLETLAPVGVFRALGWYFALTEDYARLREP
ncbi:MAG: hypothetical protein IPG17_30855 [Sandaracinaceae bacterium]|nr:hypothetical protein [Sandaracinaceae bacterium]MBP7683521.1 hypothetical protein [Deltaproteobacteria bacterium]